MSCYDKLVATRSFKACVAILLSQLAVLKNGARVFQWLGEKQLPLQCKDLSESNCFDLFKNHLAMEINVTTSRFLLPQEQFLQALFFTR